MAAGASALVAAMLTWASCGGGGSPAPQTPPATAAFDLEEATIADLQQRMERGQDTARSLVEKYTARIEQLDRQGPALRSVIELNPEALTIADRLDAERKQKGARGPLHGIPILVKDNIATANSMTTTAGSLALEGMHAPQDAFVASRLRERRRGYPRQGEPQRVGELSIDAFVERVERARRTDEKSVHARSEPVRFELGFGGRRRRQPGGRRDWNRNRRIDRVSCPQIRWSA